MMAAPAPSYYIEKQDGSSITAQEAYDAFMNGTVIVDISSVEAPGFAIIQQMFWVDSDGTSTDPNDVVGVVYAIGNLSIPIGDVPNIGA